MAALTFWLNIKKGLGKAKFRRTEPTERSHCALFGYRTIDGRSEAGSQNQSEVATSQNQSSAVVTLRSQPFVVRGWSHLQGLDQVVQRWLDQSCHLLDQSAVLAFSCVFFGKTVANLGLPWGWSFGGRRWTSF